MATSYRGDLYKMKAVILSAGYGTRLKPLTDKIAKPLVKVLGVSVIEYTLNFLDINGIKDVYINRHYFPEQFESVKIPQGMKITFSTEKDILGTLGGLLSFKDHLMDDDFVVVNGDIIFNFDFKQAYHVHRTKNNLATMVVRQQDKKISSFVYLDDFSNVVDIGKREDDVYQEHMFAGIHIINPDFFNKVKHKEIPSCLVKDFYIPYIKEGGRITGFAPDGDSFFWSEIGDLKSYLDTNIKMLSLLSRYKLDNQLESFLSDYWFNDDKHKVIESVEGVWLGEGYYIDHNATILPPVFIGAGSKIMGGCTIGPDVVIGRNVLISENTQVNNAIILDQGKVSSLSLVEEMVIGSDFTFNAQKESIN